MTVTRQPTPPKQGVRARERNALERLEQIERDLINVVGSIQKALDELNQRFSAVAEVLDATVATLGEETINQRIVDTRKERSDKQVADAKAALEKAVADGKLSPCESVNDKSYITGIERDKEGKPLEPGYTQLNFAAVKPEYQEKLRGQKVGAKLETEVGSFEVTGIFEEIPPPPKPTPEATDAAQAPPETPAVGQ